MPDELACLIHLLAHHRFDKQQQTKKTKPNEKRLRFPKVFGSQSDKKLYGSPPPQRWEIPVNHRTSVSSLRYHNHPHPSQGLGYGRSGPTWSSIFARLAARPQQRTEIKVGYMKDRGGSLGFAGASGGAWRSLALVRHQGPKK